MLIFETLAAEYKMTYDEVWFRVPWRQIVLLRGLAEQRHYDRMREASIVQTYVKANQKALPPQVATPLRVAPNVDLRQWAAAQDRRAALDAVKAAGGVAGLPPVS